LFVLFFSTAKFLSDIMELFEYQKAQHFRVLVKVTPYIQSVLLSVASFERR
jgi:hypothetical protein